MFCEKPADAELLAAKKGKIFETKSAHLINLKYRTQSKYQFLMINSFGLIEII